MVVLYQKDVTPIPRCAGFYSSHVVEIFLQLIQQG